MRSSPLGVRGHVLIAGSSGSGKTTLARYLRRQGILAVDGDAIRGLGNAHDARGRRLSNLSLDQWKRAAFRYLWDRPTLARFLSRNPDVVVCGACDNMFELDLEPLFERRVFLSASWPLLQRRLGDVRRDNGWGSTKAQRSQIRRTSRDWPILAQMRGFQLVDARRSPADTLATLRRVVPRPYYLIVRGPLGVGKSTIARALARTIEGEVVAIDAIVDRIWDGGSAHSFLRANVKAAERARRSMLAGRPVVFDGCFYWTSQLSDLIARLPFPHRVFTLEAPLSVCIRRDAQRRKSFGAEAARQVFRKVARIPPGVRIDATRDARAQVREIHRHLPAAGVRGVRGDCGDCGDRGELGGRGTRRPFWMAQVAVPEYKVAREPDFRRIGAKVDRAIGSSFPDGRYIVRAIGTSDHPEKSTDDLIAIVLETGTDKYDPSRKAIGEAEFSGYDYDIHAVPLEIRGSRPVPDAQVSGPGRSSWFGGTAWHFYHGAIIDRDRPMRLDLLLFYDHRQVIRAGKKDPSVRGVRRGLARHLYRFRDRKHRRDALVGLVEILR